MIPAYQIAEWRQFAPWKPNAQVEQDFVISRALVEIFEKPFLGESLAFRGGTALYKLFLSPASRYSEDIDLVQRTAEPIGKTLDEIQSVLNTWLGKPARKFKEGRVNLVYRFNEEGAAARKQRLKIEINTREHFSVYGYKKIPFQIKTSWYDRKAEITTFSLNELLATKLRALYQRKKGRDLFDLYLGLKEKNSDSEKIIDGFQRYLDDQGVSITRAQFEKNLAEKMLNDDFKNDLTPLLATEIEYSQKAAFDLISKEIIQKLPGEPWKGDGG